MDDTHHKDVDDYSNRWPRTHLSLTMDESPLPFKNYFKPNRTPTFVPFLHCFVKRKITPLSVGFQRLTNVYSQSYPQKMGISEYFLNVSRVITIHTGRGLL